MSADQQIAGIDLVGFRGELSHVEVDAQWHTYHNGEKTRYIQPVGLMVASLVELANQPFSMVELDATATKLYRDAVNHSADDFRIYDGPIGSAERFVALEGVMKPLHSPLKPFIFRVGRDVGRQSFLFFCDNITDPEYGKRKLQDEAEKRDDLRPIADLLVESYVRRYESRERIGKEPRRVRQYPVEEGRMPQPAADAKGTKANNTARNGSSSGDLLTHGVTSENGKPEADVFLAKLAKIDREKFEWTLSPAIPQTMRMVLYELVRSPNIEMDAEQLASLVAKRLDDDPTKMRKAVIAGISELVRHTKMKGSGVSLEKCIRLNGATGTIAYLPEPIPQREPV